MSKVPIWPLARNILCSICIFILSSCGAVKPIHETDVPFHIELKRDYVKHHATTDYISEYVPVLTSEYGYFPIITEIELTILAGGMLIDLGQFIFKGCDVYVYPEGFSKKYKQQIYWGNNRIYLPRQFAEKKGKLYFTIEGTYKGAWIFQYEPGLTDRITFSKNAEKPLTVIHGDNVKIFEVKKDSKPEEKTDRTVGLYIVEKGDFLGDISRKIYGSPDYVKDIIKVNPELKDNEVLEVGMILIIPEIQDTEKPVKDKE